MKTKVLLASIAAVSAAGFAFLYARSKRSKMNAETAPNGGRKSRHLTDVFSKAKKKMYWEI